jgi:dipeptidyl-peptidase-3
MTRRCSAVALCLVASITATGAQAPARAKPSVAKAAVSSPLVERVGDTGFIRLESPSFSQLTPRQKALAYWLTQASIAIDPIIYDQLSRFGLREKRLFEGVMAHHAGVPPEAFRKIREYALLFWANRGNHNENTSQKFVPSFTFEDLQDAALKAQADGAFKTPSGDLPPLAGAGALKKELADLRTAIFDPAFEPMMTAKTPPPGKDILQASANNFYQGVTLEDLKNFKEQYPLNSRIVKDVKGIHEEVFRAGMSDGRVAPGLAATYLKRAVEYLDKARALAEPAQATVIADLIRFYQTGEPKDWLQFGGDWVRNDAPVDFANGFIEVYRDARGAKGTSQSFVSITDKPVTTAMVKLAQNAAYFEEKAPWDPTYKKRDFQPPVVKAVEVLIETGDFHVTTIGDNLPNENEIHEKFGTKNFLFLGSSHALNAGGSSIAEFAASPEEAQRIKQYGEEAEDLLTAMHEVIGHGSGKLSDRVKGGAEPYLKEYYSTLEEARADLMGLWNINDPKLKALGLVEDQDAVARAMYDNAARAPLTQLRRIPRGDTIEEDHQRDRQLIAHYIRDKTGAIEYFDRGGKTYVRVKDYAKMRVGVGMLLAELMRIKAEGDYAAIKTLVDKYGVHFDPKLRDQIVTRFKALNLPTYWAGVYPTLTWDGTPTPVIGVSRRTDPAAQYLEYASMYDSSLRRAGAPARGAARGRR